MTKRYRFSQYLIPSVMLIYSFIILANRPDGLSAEINSAYTVLVISSWVYTFILFVVSCNYRVDIFNPFVFISIMHVFLYLIAPIRSIVIGDLGHKAGAYTFDGAVKGTVIATVCYFVIAVAYHFKFISRIKKYDISVKSDSQSFDHIDREKAILLSWIMWGIGFAATVAYLALRGMSLRYILSLGTSGTFNDDLALNSSFAFLSVIANIMFGSWLMIFYYSKARILVWASFILLMLCLIVRGFRIFIVILVAAPAILHYLSINKRPKGRTLLLAMFLFLFMIGIIGWSRGALRKNADINLADFESNMVFEALWGNLDIYKTYYGIVNHIPDDMNYTLGQQMILYTLVLFIPRAIWPNKPQPVLRQVIGVSVNSYAVIGGSAYPALGEWYHEFGLFGCVVIAFLSGRLLKKLWNSAQNNSVISLMLFSILLPSLLQVCIRGYTPSNFWMIFTMVLPLLIIRSVCGDEAAWRSELPS